MGPCPSDQILGELLSKDLSDAESDAVLAHLDACSACRELVSAAAASCAPYAHGVDCTGPGEDATPQAVGRYLLEDVLGAGAAGVVYAAYDPRLDRRVAIKLMRPEALSTLADSRQRLEREAKAMAKLSHPNVVAVYDVGAADGQVFVAMELVHGRTLRAWMAEVARPWREIVDAFTHAGRGLAAAHAVGLVHRDFKPENVLVAEDGRVRVTDFGLARSARAHVGGAVVGGDVPAANVAKSLTASGVVAGTPAYMAPEQLGGQPADVRTDQFSFCVALYEGLFAQRPFAGGDLASLRTNVSAGRLLPPPPSTTVPRAVQACLARGLRLRPAERFESMATLLTSLARAVDARPPRRLAGAAGAALGLAALGLVATTVLVRPRAQPQGAPVRERVDPVLVLASTTAEAPPATNAAPLGTGGLQAMGVEDRAARTKKPNAPLRIVRGTGAAPPAAVSSGDAPVSAFLRKRH